MLLSDYLLTMPTWQVFLLVGLTIIVYSVAGHPRRPQVCASLCPATAP